MTIDIPYDYVVIVPAIYVEAFSVQRGLLLKEALLLLQDSPRYPLKREDNYYVFFEDGNQAFNYMIYITATLWNFNIHKKEGFEIKTKSKLPQP